MSPKAWKFRCRARRESEGYISAHPPKATVIWDQSQTAKRNCIYSYCKRRPTPLAAKIARLLNFEQLNVEDQRRIGRNHTTCTLRAVSQIRRNIELNLSTFFDELDAFGPARNDPVEREGNRLVPLVGAVEFRAIDRGATVIHKNRVGRLGALAMSFGNDFVLQTARCGVDTGLAGICGKERLSLFEI